MPIVDISISEGRTPEQLRALVTAVHTAVLETVNARPEHVTVLLREVPRTRWAVGDTTLAERDAAADGPDSQLDVGGREMRITG